MRYFVSTLALVLACACTADDTAPGDVNTLLAAPSDTSLIMNVMDLFKLRDSVIAASRARILSPLTFR